MFSKFLLRSSRPKTRSSTLEIFGNFRPYSVQGFTSPNPKPTSRVAIFWDLDNKPPDSFPPYEAAMKLQSAAASFGFVKHMVAYANRHAFSYVPMAVREERKERKFLNKLENKGLIRPSEAYLCRVCGRRFYAHEKLVNHFREIHEREHQKRLNQIESARGNRRVKLVAKYAMKMEKYKRAARNLITPKEGYGLADELRRGGFSVKRVSDKPEAAGKALKEHMMDVMDKREAECIVLVSDDTGFVEILREAKEGCLKTVVVGDENNGALKRVADVGFSWTEVLMGKAKKEVEKVVGRWKDRDVLKRLEWTYVPVEVQEKMKMERGFCRIWGIRFDDYEDGGNGDEIENVSGFDFVEKGGGDAWWEMTDDEDNVGSSRQCRLSCRLSNEDKIVRTWAR